VKGGEWLNCPVVIPYIGGKYYFSKTLLSMSPLHNRYIEVFAGGLSVFFRKPPAKKSVVNDVDKNLINLYICVIEKLEEFKEYIYWYPNSRDLWQLLKESFNTNEEFTIPDPKRAATYFYLIRNTFNKTLVNNTFSTDSYWNTDIIEELKYSRKKFNNTTIENLDFEDLINKYKPEEGDFWYLDPPYVVADKRKYYSNNFTFEDHVRLKDKIDLIHSSGGKFMISYDDKPDIKELYRNYNIHAIPVKYMANRGGDTSKLYNELVIINYDVLKQESLF